MLAYRSIEKSIATAGAARRTIEKREDDLSNLHSVEVDDVELGFRRTRQCDLAEGAGRFAALIGRFEQSMDLHKGPRWPEFVRRQEVCSRAFDGS